MDNTLAYLNNSSRCFNNNQHFPLHLDFDSAKHTSLPHSTPFTKWKWDQWGEQRQEEKEDKNDISLFLAWRKIWNEGEDWRSLGFSWLPLLIHKTRERWGSRCVFYFVFVLLRWQLIWGDKREKIQVKNRYNKWLERRRRRKIRFVKY